MERRDFLKAGAVPAALGAAGGLAAPAVAQQANRKVTWRLTLSFPRNLETLYGAATTFSRIVSEATQGEFTIRVFSPGELVPALQAREATSNGSVESCFTASSYSIGTDPAFMFGTVLLFGLNSRQQLAWMYELDGLGKLNRLLYEKHNVLGFPLASTGAQMGGWFRKEIRSPEDLRGLKFRIGGLAGHVFQRLGSVPQQIAAGDIYPSLERGTIDAAEWIGPYDDEKLGLYKVAPYYYYPGWWEGTGILHLFVNKPAWEALPADYRSIVHNASITATQLTMARYDALNPPALLRLVAQGAQVRPFPNTVLDACYDETVKLHEEYSRDPVYAELYRDMSNFRTESYRWLQLAEYAFDSYQIRRLRR
ncbi:TRAP transporter substrate-binding protein DctP [Roseomonas sp. NAR14]|uniref:TRAP transporter substrate-binding protein DctP n=1 Tax=Roseomonas acroporae TaxID=2937791 RepID=A0A9X1Y6E3_9PROT|nr:TRAP transporter substrate-binding protein DctP [Roseomonas acroporae]MCK8783080.1 TRAP transporter substrate-binding protein DctP [Roseomonas acroporae]